MGPGQPSQSPHHGAALTALTTARVVTDPTGRNGLTDRTDRTDRIDRTDLTAHRVHPGLTRVRLSNRVRRVVTIGRSRARRGARLFARLFARLLDRLFDKSHRHFTRPHKTPVWRAKMHVAAPATCPISSPTAAALHRSPAQPHWPKVARACGYPS
jgi:hypothetical protein